MEKAKYHSYQEIRAMVDSIQSSSIAKVESIGLTHQQRPIEAIRISAAQGKVPRLLCIGGIHGSEWVGTEMVLQLMNKLVSEYGKNQRITDLVNEREIWLIPIVNPDGFVRRQRKTAQGVDLNRNFGVGFSNKGLLERWKRWLHYPGPYPFSEPETQALKTFVERHDFVASISFHSFGGVIYFPYGHKRQKTKDHELFKMMASEMRKRQPYQRYWIKRLGWLYPIYSLKGCFEDELYQNHGTLSFLIEISRGGFRISEPSSWLNLFRWFNPSNLQYHIENNLEAAIFLLDATERIGERDSAC